jgi:hypothetical protein
LEQAQAKVSQEAIIPDRLIHILRSAEATATSRFPPTEVFNEGWMLRLLLDAFQRVPSETSPLRFEQRAIWYSEAWLASPFGAQVRSDALAEGFTSADGVIGHFAFRPTTRAGLELAPDATQFIVVEAKMFSSLSSGTKNAPGYNQAARNVACMAEALARAGRTPESFSSLGFYVAAPVASKRRPSVSTLESILEPDQIRAAVHRRIEAYEAQDRKEATSLREWEAKYFLPLMRCLADRTCLQVLTWETCIEAVANVDTAVGEELGRFYERCLSFWRA